jgi:hypothetical protein
MFAGSRPFDITKNPRFRYAYRIFGLLILGVLILIVLGFDPYIEVKNYVINFPDHWAAFTNQCSIVWTWISEHSQTAWTWISDHAVSSSNWITDQINSGWRVVKDQWLPAMKVK